MLHFLFAAILLSAGLVLSQDCEPVLCRMYCQHGWAKDEKGCDVCACREAPIRCPPLCRNYCPNGRVLDENGCPTCQCINMPVDPFPYPDHCGPVCLMYCPNGNVLDDQGCPLCQCKP